MLYPLIIFGAGASHDYINPEQRDEKLEKYKPPLVNSLFNKEFRGIMELFEEMGDLPATVVGVVTSGGSLEKWLSDLAASKKHDWREEIISFRFYLQDLFQTISYKYGNRQANNYRSLMGQIRHHFKEACIVNFNYDLLLEQGLKIGESIESYINNPIKVIKVHGSCDWVYKYESPYHKDDKDIIGSYEFLIKKPDFLDGLMTRKDKGIYVMRSCITERYQKIDNGRLDYYYPAIALPLFNKDKFLCPNSHIVELEEAMKRTDGVVIIGWNADDSKLIEMMKKYITKEVPAVVIAAHKKDCSSIKNKLFDLPLVFEVEKFGFSDFVGSPENLSFFSN